ncbi:MAG: hypothetical protein PVG65_04490, partial [Candidatus Thorarchaeota archaeon]
IDLIRNSSFGIDTQDNNSGNYFAMHNLVTTLQIGFDSVGGLAADGLFSEIRLSRAKRSDGWISITKDGLHDDLINYTLVVSESPTWELFLTGDNIGPPGPAGSSGTSGTSGTSGANGTSGTSGTSGQDGALTAEEQLTLELELAFKTSTPSIRKVFSYTDKDLTKITIYDSTDAGIILFTKDFTYTGKDLTQVVTTRISDGAQVVKDFTYDNKDLTVLTSVHIP